MGRNFCPFPASLRKSLHDRGSTFGRCIRVQQLGVNCDSPACRYCVTRISIALITPSRRAKSVSRISALRRTRLGMLFTGPETPRKCGPSRRFGPATVFRRILDRKDQFCGGTQGVTAIRHQDAPRVSARPFDSNAHARRSSNLRYHSQRSADVLAQDLVRCPTRRTLCSSRRATSPVRGPRIPPYAVPLRLIPRCRPPTFWRLARERRRVTGCRGIRFQSESVLPK